MKAVIDRFEDEYAVVLLGDGEVPVDIPKGDLPKGVKEGSWLQVTFTLDEDGSNRQEEKISKLLEKLKNKNI